MTISRPPSLTCGHSRNNRFAGTTHRFRPLHRGQAGCSLPTWWCLLRQCLHGRLVRRMCAPLPDKLPVVSGENCARFPASSRRGHQPVFMPKMRAAQIARPGGPLKSSPVKFPGPAPVRCSSNFRPAASVTAMDSPDPLAFSVLPGIRSMNEIYPLDKVVEAHDGMMSGRVCFRGVLTTGQ